MNFLNAGILVGLTAAALPILIHLFSRQRLREIEFSSLKFLKKLESKRLRKVKITQWIILLLRTLAIIFLVLAFARPALQKLEGALSGEAQTAAVLILDNSLASQAVGSSGSIISELRNRAVNALTVFTSEDRVALISAARPSAAGFPQPLPGGDERLRRWIFELETSDAAPDFIPALEKAAGILSAMDEPNREIYLVSSFYGWTVEYDSALALLPQGIRLFMLETGPAKLGNQALTGLEIETRILQVGGAVNLSITAANYSDAPCEEAPLSLFVGSERVASTVINIPADGETVTGMTFAPEQGGYISGYARLEIEDALAADNKRYYSFYLPECVRVYLTGDSAEVSLLKTALNPSPDRHYPVEPVYLKALDELSEHPDAAVVFLAGVDKVSPYAAGILKRMIERGGGVMLSPSAATDPSAINREFLKPMAASLFTEIALEPEGISWSVIDRSHPIFEGIFGEAGGVESPQFFRRFKLHGAGEDIISFRAGNPYLREFSTGKGLLLIFTAGFGEDWSDLAHRGIFAPLMHRAAVYLGSRNGSSALSLTAGEAVEHYVQPAKTGFSLLTPAGTQVELLPKPHMKASRVEYGETALAGIYTLLQDDRTIAEFAVNPAVETSRLDRNSIPGNGRMNLVAPDKAIADAVHTGRVGRELWRWALLIGLTMLLAETVIARLAK